MTPELQGVINGVARVPGYMDPLEDNLEEVTEFLLVPYPGACIHVPPPPPICAAPSRSAVIPSWREHGALRLHQGLPGISDCERAVGWSDAASGSVHQAEG